MRPQRYRVNKQVINETIAGEAIMIDLASGSYYSLGQVGADVWAGIESHASVDEIVGALAGRYDARADVIESTVDALLAQLLAERLVTEVDEATNGAGGAAPVLAAVPGGERLPFEPPKLEKYEDMQDLILLDPVHEVEDQRGWPHVPADDA